MALFGRETEKHDKRGAQISEWLSTITPLGPVSTGLGLMAIVDMITMVLGILLGVAAVITGWLGLQKIKALNTEHAQAGDKDSETAASTGMDKRPTGKPWCQAGICLGLIGIILSIIVPQFILTYLTAS